MPFTEVLAGEGDSFGTAVLSFQEITAVEETGNRGVSLDRGESGYDGGSEAGWGGVGDASYFGCTTTCLSVRIVTLGLSP